MALPRYGVSVGQTGSLASSSPTHNSNCFGSSTSFFSHGGELNVAVIARECAVSRKAVASYIEILQDLLLAYTLPVFRKRAKRQTTAHRKFYLFDAGVFRALRPKGPLDRPSEIDGQALEGLVAQHLRAWTAHSGNDAELYFWRTRSGVEVDFAVYGAHGVQAFEVKNAGRVDAKDLRGLRAFREDYTEAQAALLFYRGQDRLHMGDVCCLPVDDFLRRAVPGRGLVEWLGIDVHLHAARTSPLPAYGPLIGN